MEKEKEQGGRGTTKSIEQALCEPNRVPTPFSGKGGEKEAKSTGGESAAILPAGRKRLEKKRTRKKKKEFRKILCVAKNF